MATVSILKDVTIRDNKMGKTFVNALENAVNKTAKEVVMTKTVKNLKKDDLKKIFGE